MKRTIDGMEAAGALRCGPRVPGSRESVTYVGNRVRPSASTGTVNIPGVGTPEKGGASTRTVGLRFAGGGAIDGQRPDDTILAEGNI